MTNLRAGNDQPNTPPSSSTGTLAADVIRAVGDELGTDPKNLDVELNDYVDPDALNDIFSSRLDGEDRTGGRVVFQMGECTVTVHADGRVEADAARQ
jgi:hypothetical protein